MRDPALDPLCLRSLAIQWGSKVGANLGSQEQSRSQEQPTYGDAAGPPVAASLLLQSCLLNGSFEQPAREPQMGTLIGYKIAGRLHGSPRKLDCVLSH